MHYTILVELIIRFDAYGDWQRVQSRQMLWTTNHGIRCWVPCAGLAALHKTELEKGQLGLIERYKCHPRLYH
jgi:hypothetical protein